MRGKIIDMELLQQKNELTPAVGNARVNARGDELGPGGKIVRKREDVLRDYYENSNRVPDEPAPVRKETVVREEPPKAGVKVNTKTRAQQKAENQSDDWIEDEHGNFVQKGE